MEAKIKARIEELKKISQQKQNELQAMRRHCQNLEADLIALSGAIQERELILKELTEKPEPAPAKIK